MSLHTFKKELQSIPKCKFHSGQAYKAESPCALIPRTDFPQIGPLSSALVPFSKRLDVLKTALKQKLIEKESRKVCPKNLFPLSTCPSCLRLHVVRSRRPFYSFILKPYSSYRCNSGSISLIQAPLVIPGHSNLSRLNHTCVYDSFWY